MLYLSNKINEMTKDEARGILEEFYTNQVCKQIDLGESPWINLPIKDEVVYSKMSFDKAHTINEQYTFKGLLCIAYGLHE